MQIMFFKYWTNQDHEKTSFIKFGPEVSAEKYGCRTDAGSLAYGNNLPELLLRWAKNNKIDKREN